MKFPVCVLVTLAVIRSNAAQSGELMRVAALSVPPQRTPQPDFSFLGLIPAPVVCQSPVQKLKLDGEVSQLMFDSFTSHLRTGLVALQSQTTLRSHWKGSGISLNMNERAAVLGEVPPAHTDRSRTAAFCADLSELSSVAPVARF